MRSWVLGKLRHVWLLAAAVAVTGAICSQAEAASVSGVSVTKGPDWVRVHVHAPGGAFRVHELPVGSAAYRSIAIDVPNGYIAGGLEPKSRVPVNQGLVAQVRVKQMRGFVRVYVDVISFPKYQTAYSHGGLDIGIQTPLMRKWNTLTPRHW
jgi:hypothetical protein